MLRILRHCLQLPSQQRLKASRNRSGTTPCGTPSRATTPRGAADRRTATQTPRNTVQAPRSAAQTPRTSKHVSSGPTITAAMQQQSDPTSAPVTAVQEHEGVAVRAQAAALQMSRMPVTSLHRCHSSKSIAYRACEARLGGRLIHESLYTFAPAVDVHLPCLPAEQCLCIMTRVTHYLAHIM